MMVEAHVAIINTESAGEGSHGNECSTAPQQLEGNTEHGHDTRTRGTEDLVRRCYYAAQASYRKLPISA